MTDPQGSDRIQDGIPTASSSGDSGGDLPARADGDVARARGAAASGEVSGPTPRSGGRTD